MLDTLSFQRCWRPVSVRHSDPRYRRAQGPPRGAKRPPAPPRPSLGGFQVHTGHLVIFFFKARQRFPHLQMIRCASWSLFNLVEGERAQPRSTCGRQLLGGPRGEELAQEGVVVPCALHLSPLVVRESGPRCRELGPQKAHGWPAHR